jgi:hypothetical protein
LGTRSTGREGVTSSYGIAILHFAGSRFPTIAKGTPRALIREAGISVEEFAELLRG